MAAMLAGVRAQPRARCGAAHELSASFEEPKSVVAGEGPTSAPVSGLIVMVWSTMWYCEVVEGAQKGKHGFEELWFDWTEGLDTGGWDW